MEIVRFYGPKFEYRHGGTTLREHGHAKTKEHLAERGRKSARGCRATWHGRVTCCFVAPSVWQLGFVWGEFSSWRLGFHRKGKNHIFQALYGGSSLGSKITPIFKNTLRGRVLCERLQERCCNSALRSNHCGDCDRVVFFLLIVDCFGAVAVRGFSRIGFSTLNLLSSYFCFCYST